MNDGFLDFEGLTQVSAEIKTRVKSVKALPAETTDETVYLYVGEDTSNYKKGHTYQAHTYYAFGSDIIWFNTPNPTQSSQIVAANDESVIGWYFLEFDSGNTIVTRAQGSSDPDNLCQISGQRYPAGDYVEWEDITPKAASETSISVELTHNVPRLEPIDITKYLIDGSLWDRIAGTNDQSLMNDIYIGDYLNLCDPNVPNHLSAGINGGTGYVTIAGIDTLQGNYANQRYHHLVMVPGKGLDLSEPQHFGTAPMNSEVTTYGGYVNSQMAIKTLKIASAADSTINGQLYQVFGSHLKTTGEQVSDSINATGYNRLGTNSGCSNSFSWKDYQCVLMSEVEVYGSIVWSSSGYDTGNANRQLPLFAFSKIAQNNGTAYYWLKDIATARGFCYSGKGGDSSCILADYDIYVRHVRPRFVIA